MKKRALVFGGSGFIGSNLITALIGRGYEEVISADIVKPLSPILGARYLDCDVRKTITLDLGGTPVDEVYNLAAIHRTPGHADHEYFDTNIPGALNICTFCREQNIKSLVFTSSIAVYGPSETAKTENSDIIPVSAYGKSKFEAEKIHQEWSREDTSHHLVIARPAVVFGPGEKGNFTRLASALSKRAFFYPGRNDTIKCCGYVEDLINSFAFSLSLERNVYLYNFCYPKALTITDICNAFHKIAGFPKPLLTVPLSLMLTAAICFEAASLISVNTGINRQRIMKLVQSTHILPEALINDGFEFDGDIETGLQRWEISEPSGVFQ